MGREGARGRCELLCSGVAAVVCWLSADDTVARNSGCLIEIDRV